MESSRALAILIVCLATATANAKRMVCTSDINPKPCAVRCRENYHLNERNCTCECIIKEFDCPNGSHFDEFNCKCVFCERHEEWSDCGNPLCEKTCDTYDDECTIFPFRCEAYCYCEEGYVRNSERECIEIDHCPPSECCKHEHYEDCGTACPETCDDHGELKVCTEQCASGCFCNEGYVKADNGTCILRWDCPPLQ